MRGLQHQLLGMRGAAQEREIRGDGEFEIARHVTQTVPCINQRGGDERRVAVEARRGTARSAAPPCPRRGNSRARGAAFFAPPGAFDALGAFGGDHFVQRAAPAEAHRRAVRHQRQNVLDRLGLGEQPQRARAQSGLGAEAAERIPAEFGWLMPAPARMRRRARGCGCPARRAAKPAAGRAARSGDRSGGRARLDLRAAEADLLIRAGLGIEHREPRQIEAETRIDFIAQRGEPLDE